MASCSDADNAEKGNKRQQKEIRRLKQVSKGKGTLRRGVGLCQYGIDLLC
jgi:hypothetical protein